MMLSMQVRVPTIALTLALLAVSGLSAFTFQPITQDYAPAGEGASHVFRVANTTDSQIAVRVSVRPRRIEPDGTEIQGDPSEDFVVYPGRLLLDPGDSRSVRVVWTGGTPEQELAYRIIAEQLPVAANTDQPDQGGTIVLTYRYEGSIYVVPPGARPEVGIAAVEPIRRGETEVLRITVENTGTRHTLLSQPRLELRTSAAGEPVLTLNPDDLVGLAGENMLATSVRHFTVPLPEDLPQGRLFGTIILDDN